MLIFVYNNAGQLSLAGGTAVTPPTPPATGRPYDLDQLTDLTTIRM